MSNVNNSRNLTNTPGPSRPDTSIPLEIPKLSRKTRKTPEIRFLPRFSENDGHRIDSDNTVPGEDEPGNTAINTNFDRERPRRNRKAVIKYENSIPIDFITVTDFPYTQKDTLRRPKKKTKKSKKGKKNSR